MPVIYTVSKVTRYLRDLLTSDPLLQDIWVSGEAANLARPGSGHTYFSLRDATATVRCVMFRSAADNGSGAELLANGTAVVVHGRATVYEARGELQLVVDLVRPEGIGELQLKLEALKLKLEREGLFEPSRKRALPRFPRRIGVVTSPTGAVWQDIQTVVQRRYPLVELVLAPTPVQGDMAAPGIVEAFDALNELPDIDVVILARGGGSMEDLWPFNEEVVARAIFASRAPVISAVGHETDVTIADLVADRRAPTPSAAAEMAVPDRFELLDSLAATERALSSAVSSYLTAAIESLGRLEERLGRAGPDFDAMRLRLDDMLRSAASYVRNALEVRAARFQASRVHLVSLNPLETLRRGYAIVEAVATGEILTESRQVGAGDAVGVTLSRGGFDATVTSVR